MRFFHSRFCDCFWVAPWLYVLVLVVGGGAEAQVNVLTAHNDIARTGQNLNETILTPSNVNPTQFGKLFSQSVNGVIYAQPLYVSQVAIPGLGTHNVVYVATTTGNPNGGYGQFSGDSVYAFDADTNGGVSAAPLWQVSLLTNTAPAGTYRPRFGIVGTPVIDLASQSIYVVSSEIQGSVPVYRLHALSIATGAENFGGPVLIAGSVPGTGTGSVGGVLSFDAAYHLQRPALLFLNGVVYVGFGALNDQGPWHGWIFSYAVNPTTHTLQQINAFCTTANGSGGGIWMGGSGLAAEVYNSAKPYGRMFFATGNGSYSASSPYSNTMAYGMTLLDLDLTGGVMTAEDEFTPFNEAGLTGDDGDLGAGGPVLLPTQTIGGKTLNPLVQIGKSGMIYILDRDNNADGSNNPATEYSPAGLGSFNTTNHVVQEVQTPILAGSPWGAGVWGTEAYWNNSIYSGGTNDSANVRATYTGSGTSLTAYSFVNGVISTTPTSQSAEQFLYPGPTPSISANGATNGIVWALMDDPPAAVGTNEILLAYNASNLAGTLYSSNDNPVRDSPGLPAEFNPPTIANGKVYVGASGAINVYGLLGATPTAPFPIINPPSGTFAGPQTVTITDAVAGATIYYTTNGSTPTTSSPVYQSSTPLVVSNNATITAIASPTGYLQSAPNYVIYQFTNAPANPVFSLAGSTYTGLQTLTITESTPGAVVYYTIDGQTPTTSSAVYSQPLSIPISETVNAIAVSQAGAASPVVTAAYTIQPAYAINFSQGFSQADGPMQFNGSTDLDDFRLQLTNGGLNEAGSAFYATPVNIQQFTTTFTFQLSNPAGDGITFTIQNNGPTALGSDGGSLGYAGIPKSVAIKFDLFNNDGEGPNSTGLYIDGAAPTVPAINLTAINLHSGDYINAALIYNGTTLTLTLTDAVTLATWSQSFAINIPAIVGGNTAYVGFTGGTGGLTSSQKLTSWTYLVGQPAPYSPTGFDAGGFTLNGGATLNGSSLELTDGGQYEARSAFFTKPVSVQQFTTSFNFQITNPNANGFTFTIQGGGPTALGGNRFNLGYGGIPNSVAIKFDLYNSAGEGIDSTGLYTYGNQPTIPATDLTSTGINLHSGDVFNAQLIYNGVTLTVVITDTVTQASAVQTYTINIPATVGSLMAYVGFTGATGGQTAVQQILNWTYSPTPVTGSTSVGALSGPQSPVTLNGGATLVGPTLELTDGGQYEARSAFFTTPVNIQQFTTSFDFELINPNANGFTFTIQGAGGPAAVGGNRFNLGYGGISNSVAVKFDLWDSAGEGADSTGLYTNGAVPTVPAIDLSSSGINLHSEDLFNAQITYNGVTLTVVITDMFTQASATQTYTVNIPAIVGGPTAYVGFTGGDGGQTAIQEIVNWTYAQ